MKKVVKYYNCDNFCSRWIWCVFMVTRWSKPLVSFVLESGKTAWVLLEVQEM